VPFQTTKPPSRKLLDIFSVSRGRTFIKAGADVRWYQLNAIAPSSPTGTFAFTTTGTNLQTTSGSSEGNAFASFSAWAGDTLP